MWNAALEAQQCFGKREINSRLQIVILPFEEIMPSLFYYIGYAAREPVGTAFTCLIEFYFMPFPGASWNVYGNCVV